MSVTQSHPGDDRLLAYASGGLKQTEIDEIEAHLLACQQCGDKMDQIIRDDSIVVRMRDITRDKKTTRSTGLTSTTGGIARDTDTEIFVEDRWIGATLGNHELLSIMGSGGMGVVYRATDSLIGRDVAIKILHESVARDPSARSRFLAEARAQGKLNHPNVVTIYQIDELEETMFIVMELLHGGSVGDQLKTSGALHWHEASRILMQACRGLSAAHAAGLIHRDIKPENLLFDGARHVKLSDFGLAKSIDSGSLTGTHQLIGTPQFMSPEQCQCKTIDARSDVYQLGATYYALLTGSNPYGHVETALQAIDAHCRAPIPDPRNINPDLPDDCADIIAEAMAKSPGMRYQSAGEMFEDLIALYNSVPASEKMGDYQGMAAVGDSVPLDGERPQIFGEEERRPRSRFAAVMLVGLVAIAILGNLLSGNPTTQSRGTSPATPIPSLDPLADPIKVGILHSLTGTMSGSESPVVDATILAIEEVNRDGGVLGRRIEPVVADGRSDPLTFAEQAESLIANEQVSAIFGCWASASRKAVLPTIEKHDLLLIYPVQYEGIESSPNVIYTGAAPNQQLIPAVQWAFAFQDKRRFFLVGSDYVFPRTANEIIKDIIHKLGGEVVGEEYIPLGGYEVSHVIDRVLETRPDVILNTINGDSNTAFFRAIRRADVNSSEIPTISFSIGEVELKNLNVQNMVGDYACWNYFQSIESEKNQTFVDAFRSRFGQQRVVSDPMEAAYVGVHLWARAANRSVSIETDRVRETIGEIEFSAPEGNVKIDPVTLHTFKTARIGRVETNGQFKIVWESFEALAPVPYPTTRTVQDWEQTLEDLSEGWGGTWWNPDGATEKPK